MRSSPFIVAIIAVIGSVLSACSGHFARNFGGEPNGGSSSSSGGETTGGDGGSAAGVGNGGSGGRGGTASASGGSVARGGGSVGGGETAGGGGDEGDTGGNGGSAGSAGSGRGGDDAGGAGGEPSDVPCGFDADTTVRIADRVDSIFDEARCRLYVSTESGVVESYDLKTRTLEPLVDLGSPLVAMDLSPSGDTLLVADSLEIIDDTPHNRVHVVDLVHRTSEPLKFSLEPVEAGSFMPLFVDERTFLFTSASHATAFVPLRKVNLADGSFRVLTHVRASTWLALSADGSTVAYAQPGSMSGEFGRYSVASDVFDDAAAGVFLYSIAVNRDATQYALPTAGLYIYGTVGPPNVLDAYPFPVGAVYSPTSDLLYVSLINSARPASIEAIDTKSLTSAFVIDKAANINAARRWALSGRLRISRSGYLLAASVEGGVRVYRVRP